MVLPHGSIFAMWAEMCSSRCLAPRSRRYLLPQFMAYPLAMALLPSTLLVRPRQLQFHLQFLPWGMAAKEGPRNRFQYPLPNTLKSLGKSQGLASICRQQRWDVIPVGIPRHPAGVPATLPQGGPKARPIMSGDAVRPHVCCVPAS